MKIYDMTTLGQAVRDRRKKYGYTQGYVSDVTGLSASFISDLENGKSTVEMGKAMHLIQMLGMDILLEER